MPYVKPDHHVAQKFVPEYTVRSVYFDSPDMVFYKEKIEGVPHRIKLRMRTYDDAEDHAPLFFEIKRKHRIPMSKNRAPFEFDTAMDILSGLRDPSDSCESGDKKILDCKRFIYHMHMDQLSPKVLVVYDREPYESMSDKTVRITFDKYLRSSVAVDMNTIYDQNLTPVMQDHFILEVKYNSHYPSWLEPIVNSFNLKQTSASKYCMCIENHPEIAYRDPWGDLMSFHQSLAARA